MIILVPLPMARGGRRTRQEIASLPEGTSLAEGESPGGEHPFLPWPPEHIRAIGPFFFRKKQVEKQGFCGSTAE